MKNSIGRFCVAAAVIAGMAFAVPALADPLPSWQPSAAKTAIVEFVGSVTDPQLASYIEPSKRIAVFDNDGTLWAEQPMYFQVFFALDRIKAMAAADPSFVEKNPAFKAAVDGDLKSLLADHHKGLLAVMAATHSGMTTDEFKQAVAAWLKTAKHPTTGQAYTDMVYQPMLELLTFLREEGFHTYIVSGGGIDFIRVFSESAYGIPPENVIGSSVKSEFELTETGAVTRKLPELFFFDDKEGKPVAIDHHLGRRPIIAVGNSDGDLQMLQYTTRVEGPALAVLVHHTDADREWAYDKGSAIGGLDAALDEAQKKNWTVIDMKADWRTVFPFELR